MMTAEFRALLLATEPGEYLSDGRAFAAGLHDAARRLTRRGQLKRQREGWVPTDAGRQLAELIRITQGEP
jgi:hypothetical protein